MKTIHHTVGLLVQLLRPLPRDERGLSQSTENAILLAGAVAMKVMAGSNALILPGIAAALGVAVLIALSLKTHADVLKEHHG